MQTSKRGNILWISISAPLFFAAAFVLVVVAHNHFHTPPEVDVMNAGFAPQTIEIQQDETLHFVNRSSTITQFLCLGSDKRCNHTDMLSQLQAPPPRSLQKGIRIAPGQAEDVVFDTEGRFHITSTVVPGLNLIVTVDASN